MKVLQQKFKITKCRLIISVIEVGPLFSLHSAYLQRLGRWAGHFQLSHFDLG